MTEGTKAGKKSSHRPSFDTVQVGQIVNAYVQEIDDEKAWLLLGPHLRGRLFVLDSSTKPSELKDFKARYAVGQVIRCSISGKDPRKGTLDLSCRNVNNASGLSAPNNGQIVERGPSEHSQMAIKPGMLLGGRVARVYPGISGLSIQIGGNTFGRVHVCHLSDSWEDYPMRNFKEGQFVRCFVLDVGASFDGKPRIDLSLKTSLGGSGIENSSSNQKPRYAQKSIAHLYRCKARSISIWLLLLSAGDLVTEWYHFSWQLISYLYAACLNVSHASNVFRMELTTLLETLEDISVGIQTQVCIVLKMEFRLANAWIFAQLQGFGLQC